MASPVETNNNELLIWMDIALRALCESIEISLFPVL